MLRCSPRPFLLSRRQILGDSLAAGGGALLCPALAQSTSVRVLRAGSRASGEEPAGPTWAFDGTVPGPLLRVRRGEEVLYDQEGAVTDELQRFIDSMTPEAK